MLAKPLSLLLAVSAVLLACSSAPQISPSTGAIADEEGAPLTSWQERRARPTHVTAPVPSPSLVSVPVIKDSAADGVERARYPAQDGALLALIARPPSMPLTADTPVERLPGIVLMHDGDTLTVEMLQWASPFQAAGFIVLMPTLRGENGNPGRRELLRGELDDLKAAARFFAAEPDVDVDRLYAFGHGQGGALVSLLALDDDQPFRLLATSSGVYGAATFLRWHLDDPRGVPFDTADLDERTVRALLPNAEQMVRPLLIYAGDQDAATVATAARVKARHAALVDVISLKGDQRSSLAEALRRFRARALEDALSGRGSARSAPVSSSSPPTSPASRSAP